MATHVHPNIELLERSLGLLTSGRVEDVAELLTDDFRINVHGAPTRVGRDAWRENVAIMQASFADLSAEILHAIADRDLVAMNIRFTARHIGDFLGIPATGRTVQYASLEHYRLRDGQIAEEWIASDLGALLAQLGVEP